MGHDVLVLNQYGLKLGSNLCKEAASHIATALEHIQLANLALVEADKVANGTELTKHAVGALSKRRTKVVALAAAMQGPEGTPLLDEKNPLPVADEADDAAEETTPAKAAGKKKAAAKKPAGKKPAAKKSA